MRNIHTVLLMWVIGFATQSLATPGYLITNNETRLKSYYKVGEKEVPVDSIPNAVSVINWNMLSKTCGKAIRHCKLDVFIKTDPTNPLGLGMLSLDLKTGLINPDHLRAATYCLTVNEPAKVTLSEKNC